MIRSKPKSSTSKISCAAVEHIFFVSNASDYQEVSSPKRADLFSKSNFKNTTSACVNSRLHESYRPITKAPHWDFTSDFSSSTRMSADNTTPKPPRSDDVQEAKRLIYNWEKTHQGKIASFYSVYFVETMYKNREYEEINRLLIEVEVSALTEWSMIALLRSSFQARNYLPAWNILRNAVLEKLKTDGKDYNRLLSGLIR